VSEYNNLASNAAVENSSDLPCSYICRKPHRLHSRIHSLKVYKNLAHISQKEWHSFLENSIWMSCTQKNNHDGQVHECRCIKIHSQTSLCFVTFSLSSSRLQAILSLDLLDFFQDRQVHLIVVFLNIFHLFIYHNNSNSLKNFFHFLFVCIPLSNTSEGFQLIVCNLQTFVLIEGTFDCQVLHFFAVIFCLENKL